MLEKLGFFLFFFIFKVVIKGNWNYSLIYEVQTLYIQIGIAAIWSNITYGR